MPSSITTAAAIPIPAVPARAASPATVPLTASADRPSTAASAHQSPVSTPSQLSAIPAATTPTRADAPSSAVTARTPRNPSLVTTAPVAMPARASGRTEAFSAAPRGSLAGAGTTSTVLTCVPPAEACCATACWRNCATAGPAAEAVSSSGPSGVTTTAPYTLRSSIASRAAASSA